MTYLGCLVEQARQVLPQEIPRRADLREPALQKSETHDRRVILSYLWLTSIVATARGGEAVSQTCAHCQSCSCAMVRVIGGPRRCQMACVCAVAVWKICIHDSNSCTQQLHPAKLTTGETVHCVVHGC